MLNCIVVGWVKGRATQHTTLKHHEDDVGFRSSTQPTRAVSMLKLVGASKIRLFPEK